MSADGSIMLDWPDKERRYRLGLGELRELQERTSAGPAKLLERFASRDWLADDVREIIRLGLIGGGLDPQRALGVAGRYVDVGVKLLPAVVAAQKILMASLMGVDDDPVGKQTAEGTISPEQLPSRPSTEPAPPSDGQHDRSTNSHSLNS